MLGKMWSSGGGLVTQSCRTLVTPWTVACQAPLSMGLSNKNTPVGCHFLLQGIFPTQESNPGLLHCRKILYQLSYEGTLRNSSKWRFFTKLNILSPCDLAIIHFGIYPNELKIWVHTKTYMWMFIAALFIIAKAWSQPRCPSMSEWINKLWHDPLYYTMEYYLAHTPKKSSQTTYKHGESTSLLQWLRLPTSTARGKSSIPGQGTKILCAKRCTPPTTKKWRKCKGILLSEKSQSENTVWF